MITHVVIQPLPRTMAAMVLQKDDAWIIFLQTDLSEQAARRAEEKARGLVAERRVGFVELKDAIWVS